MNICTLLNFIVCGDLLERGRTEKVKEEKIVTNSDISRTRPHRHVDPSLPYLVGITRPNFPSFVTIGSAKPWKLMFNFRSFAPRCTLVEIPTFPVLSALHNRLIQQVWATPQPVMSAYPFSWFNIPGTEVVLLVMRRTGHVYQSGTDSNLLKILYRSAMYRNAHRPMPNWP